MRALARVGRDVNAMEEGNQRTALHYAAGYGDCATALALVHSGAHVNARDRAGMTALGWACLKGRVEVAQLLLKANADPLIKAHTGVLVGKTAVALARLHGTLSLAASHRPRSLVQNPSPSADPHPNPHPNPHPHPNPNPNPKPNPNPNPSPNVPRLCSARYGTSEDNPAEPSEMNAEGIVRDQGLSFEFRDSNMMKVTP